MSPTRRVHRRPLPALIALLGVAAVLAAAPVLAGGVVHLRQSDFQNGTYRITEPGVYALAEDISFNPHPPGSLADDGVTVLDAWNGGLPFPSQYGDPDAGLYDPAAYGIGFFAAIAIEADDVVLDLRGHTLEQSAEHALLQRFFAVVELADQPFLPRQGPSDFGGELRAAHRVVIRGGTIGRSSHHGIHGNDNRHVRIHDVDFEGFEVAAVALNGVEDLVISRSRARNRDDVPVIGTFSNARFIAPYVDWLVRSGSSTTLRVLGEELDAIAIRAALREAVNRVHEDVIVDGRGFIDATRHPDEHALFHNPHGVVDGNAYGYLVNPRGVAVGGFPNRADEPSRAISFFDVHILRQRAFVNEVVALARDGKAVIDPVGAVFMLRNRDFATGAPLTVSSLDDDVAVYTGNPLANAQALVAKAAANGEFPPFLDTSRVNLGADVIDWIEDQGRLSELAPSSADWLCNGDTMFHVNKGVIGFKLDGAQGALLWRTSARRLENLGGQGSDVCGRYAISHPDATLPGYGGAAVRGYSIAGSENVWLVGARARSLASRFGSVTGIDVFTDARNVLLLGSAVRRLRAGPDFTPDGGPNEAPDAIGVHVGPDARHVFYRGTRVSKLRAYDERVRIRDESR